jgi:hypothetical protein
MTLLSFQNGILDLELNLFIEKSIDKPNFNLNYNKSLIDLDYQDSIEKKLFYNNLGIEQGNKLINYLSNTIYGNKPDKLCIFYGSGGNGKTLLKHAIYNTFENMSFNSNINPILGDNLYMKMTDNLVDDIKNKKLMFIPEILNQDRINGNAIKNLCCNDEILININNHVLNIKCNSLLIMESNKKLDINNEDVGLLNRIEYFEFTKRYINKIINDCNENELPIDNGIINEINTDKFKLNLISLIINLN